MQRQREKILKTNPFYILDIPMSADRTRIADAAEQRSLVYDPDICARAMDELLNPVKRLAAELDWFPGVDEETIKSIKKAVAGRRAVPADTQNRLNGMDAVNALIFSLEASVREGVKGASAAADTIKTIGSLLWSMDREELLDAVNRARRAAGFTEATGDQLDAELRHKLERTADELADCIEQLPEAARLTLMNTLAEQYNGAAKQDMSADTGGSVLFCLLADRFGTDTLQARADLKEELDAVIHNVTKHGRMFNITGLMKQYYSIMDKWSRYERPLQTAAALRGAPQEESLDIVRKSLDMVMKVIKKDNMVSGYEFLCKLGDTFAVVPGAAEIIDPVRCNLGEMITDLTRKTPDEAARIKQKEKARTKAGNIIFLSMLAIIGVLALLTPPDEKQAYDPSTSYYHEIRLPYSLNSQGEFEEVSMPPTGFVFQDTMGEEGRTATLHVIGRADRSSVMRISDQEYGNGTYIYLPGEIMADSDKLPDENAVMIAREVLSESDQEKNSAEGSLETEDATKETADNDMGVTADARILTIMIREGEQTDIKLPPGKYYVSNDYGYTWYGWRFRFTRQIDREMNMADGYEYPEMEPVLDEPIVVKTDCEYTLDLPGGMMEIQEQ